MLDMFFGGFFLAIFASVSRVFGQILIGGAI